MTLVWQEPITDGGCQVLSYSLFMDDGASGSFTELDAASINNLPTLRTYEMSSFTSSDTSKTFGFKLRATNSIGWSESEEIFHVLAAVPDKPLTAPTLNLQGTGKTRIRVDYAELTTGMNGGSPILSYEL